MEIALTGGNSESPVNLASSAKLSHPVHNCIPKLKPSPAFSYFCLTDSSGQERNFKKLLLPFSCLGSRPQGLRSRGSGDVARFPQGGLILVAHQVIVFNSATRSPRYFCPAQSQTQTGGRLHLPCHKCEAIASFAQALAVLLYC